jgi:hypothetical protein
MTMAYDVDMKLELFRVDNDGFETLLDTFELDDLKKMYQEEIEGRQKRAEDDKKKKKAAKKKKDNSTESNETEPVEEAPVSDDEPVTIEKPKLKFAIELSRSGLLRLSRANVGHTYVNYKKVPKTIQLNKDQKAAAKKRLAFYQRRDEQKIRTDIARNDFEATVYKVREWLREEENEPYVIETEREDRITFLNE